MATLFDFAEQTLGGQGAAGPVGGMPRPTLAQELERGLQEGRLEWTGAPGQSEIVQKRQGLTFVPEASMRAYTEASYLQQKYSAQRQRYLEENLRAQGYAQDGSGRWLAPNAQLSQADIDEGVRRIMERYEGDNPRDAQQEAQLWPSLDKYMSTVTPDITPREPDQVASAQASAGAGLVGAVADEALGQRAQATAGPVPVNFMRDTSLVSPIGRLPGLIGDMPLPPTLQLGPISVPTGMLTKEARPTVKGAFEGTLGRDIPESVRRPIINAAETLGSQIKYIQPFSATGTGVSGGQQGDFGAAARVGAEMLVPREVWEIAIEFLPGIGTVPGVASRLTREAPEILRLARILRRSPDEVLTALKAGAKEYTERAAAAGVSPEAVMRGQGAVGIPPSRTPSVEGMAARKVVRPGGAPVQPAAALAQLATEPDSAANRELRGYWTAKQEALRLFETNDPTGAFNDLARKLSDLSFKPWNSYERGYIAGLEEVSEDVLSQIARAEPDIPSALPAPAPVSPTVGAEAASQAPPAGAGRAYFHVSTRPLTEVTLGQPSVLDAAGGRPRTFGDAFYIGEAGNQGFLDQYIREVQGATNLSPVVNAVQLSPDARILDVTGPFSVQSQRRIARMVEQGARQLDDAEVAEAARIVMEDAPRAGAGFDQGLAITHIADYVGDADDLARTRVVAALREQGYDAIRHRDVTDINNPGIALAVINPRKVQILTEAPSPPVPPRPPSPPPPRTRPPAETPPVAAQGAEPPTVPPREPPTAGGQGAGAGGVPSDPAAKLTQAIKSAGKATPEQRAMFAQERAQRTARAAGALESGQGAEAFRAAKGQLKGEFARPNFAVPAITADETTQLLETIRTAENLRFYDKVNAEQALQDLFTGRIPQDAQLLALKRAFPQQGDALIKAIIDKRGLGAKALDELVGLLGLPQALKASFDISAPFRQGMMLGWNKPADWAKSWAPMLRAFKSEGALEASVKRVGDSPWFSIETGPKAGLGFKDVGGHIYDVEKFTEGVERAGGFTGFNRSYISRMAQRIPGVNNSQRAFTTFLNEQGIRAYEDVAQRMWDVGVRDPDQYEALAKVLNHARGYGDFTVGQIGKGVNAFFSGRNFVARFQNIIDPIVQPGSFLKPSARQQAAKNLAGMIAGDMTVLGMLGAAGAATGMWSVEFDPRSTEWGKLKMGDTRIDPWAGFSPMIRLAARIATGDVKTSTGGTAPTNIKVEVLRFLRNKQAPIAALIVDWLAGENSIGEKFKLDDARLADMFVPFIAGDVVEALLDDRAFSSLAKPGYGVGLVASTVGLGMLNYESDVSGRSVRESIRGGATYKDAAGTERPYPATFKDAAGKEKPITTLTELKAASPLAAEDWEAKNPEVAERKAESAQDTTKRIRELQDTFARQQQARDETLLATDPERWRRESGDASSRISAAISERAEDYGPDRKPQTQLDAVNQKFEKARTDATDSATGAIDWEKVDRAVAQFSDEEQNLLFENRLRGETPARKEYIKALEKLEPYFEQRDLAWANFQKANPTFQAYKSLDEYRIDRIKFVMDKNPQLSRPTVEQLVDQALGALTQFGSDTGTLYLTKHKDVIPLLSKYGFYVPALVRPLAVQPAAAR